MKILDVEYNVDSQLRRSRMEITNSAKYIIGRMNEVLNKLETAGDPMLNSLGELQGNGVALDIEIGKLQTLYSIKKDLDALQN